MEPLNSTHAAAFELADVHPWILYLDPELHPMEWKVVHTGNLDTYILVLDVRKSPHRLPPWLSVLPALVDTRSRTAYRGASCMTKLATIELPPEYVRKLSKASKTQRRWDASTL